MKIREVMTETVEYIESSMSLMDAAKRMKALDCGFMPVSDKAKTKLLGVITDRDITIRGLGEGLDPEKTTVDQIKSPKVLYCYAGDDVESAAESMRKQRVYRLIVLDNEKQKNLAGIITLGDLMRVNQNLLASQAARAIVENAA